MPDLNKYKIERELKRRNPQTNEMESSPLPNDKITGISWAQLVKVIAENGIKIAKEIRLHNVEQKGGTDQISRYELFQLWKEVERKRDKDSRIKTPPV
jgi:hypothetical protein